MKTLEPRQRYKVASITIDSPERFDELVQLFLNTEAGTDWKYVSMFVRAEAQMSLVQNQMQPKQVLVVVAIFEEMGLFSRLNTIPPQRDKDTIFQTEKRVLQEIKPEDPNVFPPFNILK